jgi:hypothetical protein
VLKEYLNHTAVHNNTRKGLESRIRTLARHAWKQTWSHTEFLSDIETTVITAHRLGRKGNSNNRELEYRDFTVFEPAVTRKVCGNKLLSETPRPPDTTDCKGKRKVICKRKRNLMAGENSPH